MRSAGTLLSLAYQVIFEPLVIKINTIDREEVVSFSDILVKLKTNCTN